MGFRETHNKLKATLMLKIKITWKSVRYYWQQRKRSWQPKQTNILTVWRRRFKEFVSIMQCNENCALNIRGILVLRSLIHYYIRSVTCVRVFGSPYISVTCVCGCPMCVWPMFGWRMSVASGLVLTHVWLMVVWFMFGWTHVGVDSCLCWRMFVLIHVC